MSGLDVLAKLRQMDPAACVIVVSAGVQDSPRQLALAAGASGFVIKPVDGAAPMVDVLELPA